MIPEFSELNDEEVDLMLKAPLITSILVAGADSTIDKAEMREAIGILSIRPKNARKELKAYYTIITCFGKLNTGGFHEFS